MLNVLRLLADCYNLDIEDLLSTKVISLSETQNIEIGFRQSITLSPVTSTNLPVPHCKKNPTKNAAKILFVAHAIRRK